MKQLFLQTLLIGCLLFLFQRIGLVKGTYDYIHSQLTEKLPSKVMLPVKMTCLASYLKLIT